MFKLSDDTLLRRVPSIVQIWKLEEVYAAVGRKYRSFLRLYALQPRPVLYATCAFVAAN